MAREPAPEGGEAVGTAARGPTSGPRRRRVARGPLVIGEPAPPVQAMLAAEDPYRADTIVDGGDAFGLTVRAASVRGLAKRWAGGPRQDDICLGRHEPSASVIAAVADGVSAAARSQLGAALAVRHAVTAVRRQLDIWHELDAEAHPELDWPAVFRQAAWALLEAHRTAAGDPQAPVEDAAREMATTLLVAVVSAAPDDGTQAAGGALAQLASVGDSCALRLCGRRFEQLLGAEPADDGLLGARVQALPRALEEVRSTRLELAAGEVLLLATDGFTLPLAGGENDVGALFSRELRRPPGMIEFARLLDFSRSTYDDDRSLVAVWPPSGR